MDFESKIVSTAFGKSLSGGYAVLFLFFCLVCVAFIVWAIYYATAKKAAAELEKITWLGLKDTLRYTGMTLFAIVISSSVLFVYDFGLDKIVNIIIENAKR